MLISYNWLRELTGTTAAPLILRERLTMVGLAIDTIEEFDGDFVLDVEVPSNRPDCLSHIGIAREVAVIENSKVLSPESKVVKAEGRTSDFASVEIQDAELCPRYTARVVRGVKIGPSPEWLVKRLGEIGQRPINNVADITNYVLHETGQPLHAFDLSKLTEQKIIVRCARQGEKLTTLDGVDRALDEQMLVIADAKAAVALAGVMGGLDSEISQQTSDVLIESAYFNPDSVRRTARKPGMDTEASRRFERGADVENVLNAQARCVELICEIAGGVATEDAVDVYPKPMARRVAPFRQARVEEVTSLQVEPTEMVRILTSLGFVQNHSDEKGQTFIVPSWRIDVSIEEDLVEEIARHSGYDKIKSELPPSNMSGEYQPTETKRRALRRVLRDLGFDEAINFSFIDTAHDAQFETIPGIGSQLVEYGFVTLDNPITEEAVRMRHTLLPGLLESLRHNFNHGIRDVSLFEIGRVFAGSAASDLPLETTALGIVATGAKLEESRAAPIGEVDFYAVKGALEAAVDGMKLAPLEFDQVNAKHLRTGQSAVIKLADGTGIGTIGRLAEEIAVKYKFRQPVYIAELDLNALLESGLRAIHYKPLPRFPSVVRDVTLLVGRDVSLSKLLQAIDSQSVADYSTTKLVGTYEGKNIPEGLRSITLRVEYRSDDRTLRDEEVEERHRALIDFLLQEFNAQLH